MNRLVTLAAGWLTLAFSLTTASAQDAGTGDDEPTSVTADAPADTSGIGAIDTAVPTIAPPVLWQEWRIEGTLIDDKDVVIGFLTPVMERNRTWRDEDQRNVIEFCGRIGYDLIIRNELMSEGGVSATLVLQPITLVRHVEVNINVPLIRRMAEPLFGDEIKRRMTLRPGSPLKRDKKLLREQLQAEADRLAFFLRNEGFFDATVIVAASAKGLYASKLMVQVNPGTAYRIGKLTVVGNSRIANKKITDKFHHDRFCLVWKLCVGTQRFSRQQIGRDVDAVVAMYQKRGYPGVRVRTNFDIRHSYKRETKTVEFTVEIRERRQIDIVFEGNTTKFDEEKLMAEITLSREGSYDDVEVRASSEAIRRYYQRRGHFEANVTWERVRFGVFERILFSIDEGPRLNVRDVSFKGNKSIASGRLARNLKTREFKRIIVGESGGFATTIQLRQDIDRLTNFYVNEGYRDVVVTARIARDEELLDNAAALAASVAAGGEADSLFVQFIIDEGPRYLVSEINLLFAGEGSIAEKNLRAVLRLKPGDPYRQDRAQADSELLRRFYFSNGFPRAVVETTVEASKNKATKIIIRHTITENQPARIGKIALRGNFKTQGWVILDELHLIEGEPLTVASAERAQTNLRSSGLFSAVKIDYVGLEENNQAIVNVLVRIEERHDNLVEFLIAGGVSTDDGVFLEVGADAKNMFGTGARLDFRASYGSQKQSVDGKLALPRWIQRRLFGSAFLVEFAGLFINEVTPRFGNLQSIGGSMAVTKKGRRGPFQGWLLSMRYDFRLRNRDEDLVRPAGPSDDIQRSKVRTLSSTIGPVLVVDKRRDDQGRKNPLTPSRGWRLELRAQFGEKTIFGNNRFLKIGTSGQHYLRLSERFLISNNVRYDHGIPLGDSVLLPEVERFFAGGDTTVRGFEEDRLATEIVEEQAPPLGSIEQFRVRPAGGNIRMIHNLELQVRVWDDPPVVHVPIASAIFVDSGLVTNSLDNFDIEQLRHSIGVALMRLVTPFGSLSIEYAIPLDPELGDNPRGRFHVNIGARF